MNKPYHFLHLAVLFALASCYSSVQEQAAGKKMEPAITGPALLGEGIISTGDYEIAPTFSHSGDTLYFVRTAPDLTRWTICVSFFREGKWTEPEVAPFSGQYMDSDPFLSKDGQTLYFISNRPVTETDTLKSDTDIWKVAITPEGWGKPVHLEAPVNSPQDEHYPTLSDHGHLYFGSGREGGKGSSDLYRCPLQNGNYPTIESLGDSINTPDNEYEPFIAPDESYIIFMSTVPRGLANADFYISYQHKGNWSRSQKLRYPFNSDATEFSPKITSDGKYFLFSSARNKLQHHLPKPATIRELNNCIRNAGNGLGDIYYIDLSVLNIHKYVN